MILQFPDMYNLIDIPLKIGKKTHTHKFNFVVKLKKKKLTVKTEKARFQIQYVYSIESTQIPIQSENHGVNKSSQNH